MNLSAAPEDELLRQAKRQLRAEMRVARAVVEPSASLAAGRAAAVAIGPLLDALFSSTAPLTVSLFASLPGEIATRPMADALRARGARLVYPRVVGDRLVLHALPSEAEFVRSAFGIDEPTATAPEVDPGAVDLFVTPGLAFDERGHRLGFGRGYYDRLLARSDRAIRCGACLDGQLVPSVPVGEHDVSVDFILCARDGQAHVVTTRARSPLHGGVGALLSDLERENQ